MHTARLAVREQHCTANSSRTWRHSVVLSCHPCLFSCVLGDAAVQVNYRGSTGYGDFFSNAGNQQWGTGSMQHDLTDSVRWAIEKGIADPKKVRRLRAVLLDMRLRLGAGIHRRNTYTQTALPSGKHCPPGKL